ncbi:hypothetical protein [Flavobacterium sp. W22_SRS_FP1]|uniref:hypothetical protein n=1 Tax=Flavobacterium sp. W22_SRS_FP1 TaxID=3240276 RepID=UPI003F8E7874
MNVQALLIDWNLMRFVRLGLGVYIGMQAFETQSILSGLLAAFLLYQVVTNNSCCAANACAIPKNKNNSYTNPDAEYEEITSK